MSDEQSIYHLTDDVDELVEQQHSLDLAIGNIEGYCSLYDLPIPAWVALAKAELALVSAALYELTGDEDYDDDDGFDPDEPIHEDMYYKQSDDEDDVPF